MLTQYRSSVLIVEDDVRIGEIIQKILTNLNYEVVGIADSGERALVLLRTTHPHVVLMDIALPDISGIEVTRRIQAESPTPVVMLSAYDTPDLVAEATRAGAVAYLTKPIDVPALERTIQMAVARFADWREMRRLNDELRAEITERRRVEAALRESEQKYKELVELLPQPVFEITTNGHFTYVNHSGLETFRYTAAEFEKLDLFQLLAYEDRERVRRHIEMILDGKRVGGNSYTGRRRDGSTFPMLLFTSPIHRGNEAVGLRVIITNTTWF